MRSTPMTFKERVHTLMLWIAFHQPRYRQSALARSIYREYLIPLGSPIKLTPRQRAKLNAAGHGLVAHGSLIESLVDFTDHPTQPFA